MNDADLIGIRDYCEINFAYLLNSQKYMLEYHIFLIYDLFRLQILPYFRRNGNKTIDKAFRKKYASKTVKTVIISFK